ncbi:hypothetical protein [Tenacibaculum jejuense]|uniref:Probable lipoprotein n=1 Tax=Tenacibaculum jejuense TaxID=584609 RepID=A0A238UFB3_9FLAO|nr:hypothetical protein [Tenacibaculum jejuense]SNR17090.1 Probable lipoprotein precursor [Tenacibaculum jejuense]
MIKKISLYILVLASTILAGCDPTENVIFDVNNGQSLAKFTTGDQTIPVPDSGATAIISVGVSTVSDTDRRVTLSIDAANTTATTAAYTINDATAVIPAGEYIANIEIDANFTGVPVTGFADLVVNIDGVEGAELEEDLSNKVSFFRFCPFENGATFLGDYRLETQVLGIFGSTTLTDGVVTISQGATVADRVFTSIPYPGLGSFSPVNIGFSLICDDIVFSPIDDIGVGCSGGNAFAPSTANASTYTANDDSELVINFIDDARGQCAGGGAPVEVQIRLVKM